MSAKNYQIDQTKDTTQNWISNSCTRLKMNLEDELIDDGLLLLFKLELKKKKKKSRWATPK